eukprot:m.32975 g.32975  ORF g.32975 m.32975 type:complete len:656 (-) comp8473_c0_seq1:232-2199(-)
MAQHNFSSSTRHSLGMFDTTRALLHQQQDISMAPPQMMDTVQKELFSKDCPQLHQMVIELTENYQQEVNLNQRLTARPPPEKRGVQKRIVPPEFKKKEKTPFCNPCRRMVMDRLIIFLLHHPHPAVHPGAHNLFESVTRAQYQKERYKKRKMSEEWCKHCRDENFCPRNALDRFNLLWSDPIIQSRAAQDWYKEVRKIDASLRELALQLTSRLADPPAIFEHISCLAQSRTELKPIQKTRSRVKGARPPPYTDTILSAVREGSAEQVYRAVINYETNLPEPMIRTMSEEVREIIGQIGAAPSAPEEMNVNSDALPRLPSEPVAPVLSDSVYRLNSDSIARMISDTIPRGLSDTTRRGLSDTIPRLPTDPMLGDLDFNGLFEFDLRFEEVLNKPATIQDVNQKKYVENIVDCNFPECMEQLGNVALENINVLGMTEGSIIIRFVAKISSSDNSHANVAHRLQSVLRSLSADQIDKYFPGCKLDLEFSKVRQMSAKEISAYKESAPSDALLESLLQENEGIRGEIMKILAPLKRKRDLLAEENRKYARHAESEEDESDFDGFSDEEDVSDLFNPVRSVSDQSHLQVLRYHDATAAAKKSTVTLVVKKTSSVDEDFHEPHKPGSNVNVSVGKRELHMDERVNDYVTEEQIKNLQITGH